jgi:hypothetical protein
MTNSKTVQQYNWWNIFETTTIKECWNMDPYKEKQKHNPNSLYEISEKHWIETGKDRIKN